MQQGLALKVELYCLDSEVYAVFDDLLKKAEFHKAELPRQQPVLDGRQGALKPHKTKRAVQIAVIRRLNAYYIGPLYFSCKMAQSIKQIINQR